MKACSDSGPAFSSSKKPSSRVRAAAAPPMDANSPAGSCGTSQAYWAPLPSTKLSSEAGEKPGMNAPPARRGWIVRLAGFTSVRQVPRAGA